jgi:hypothetical protein
MISGLVSDNYTQQQFILEKFLEISNRISIPRSKMLCIGRDKRHRVSDATTAEGKKLKTIQDNPRMVQSLALSLSLSLSLSCFFDLSLLGNARVNNPSSSFFQHTCSQRTMLSE